MVRTPNANAVFVIKLYRAEPQDREDMMALAALQVRDTRRCGPSLPTRPPIHTRPKTSTLPSSYARSLSDAR